ncbi:hypothetical protein Clacol_002468 [Clathrus columnatus]|uniref:Uncharacterized protein n=1 Tax=Clathrus columnatus TaxID=1419009 RepID=A0AAV5A500_9AGAM|nr:hypothetical protein Clacol_002468 [Clathrus columnatus]
MATAEDKEELLLSCRYGDIEEVQQFVVKFGAESLEGARDENGNTALHMVCANGHGDILDYLLPKVKPDLLICRNNAGSIPLHWAALNKHLSIIKRLVEYPDGPGPLSINCKNLAGRSPLAEAELSEWEEGALWLTSKMQSEDSNNEAEEEISADDVRDIEVEIQDADGGVARMTLSSSKDKSS